MLPHDLEAEEAVLAALLVSEEQVHSIAGTLTPGEFYREPNQWIFAASMDLYARGEGVNTITVAHELSTRQQLDEVGGTAELHRMILQLPTAEGAPFYANIVRETATRRSLVGLAEKTARLASQDGDVGQAVAQVEVELHKLRRRRGLGPHTIGPGGRPEMWAKLEDFLGEPGRIRGLRTGWENIDRALNGLMPGRLITIGAATSVGKSAFVQNIARQLAVQNVPVLMFTTEMTADEVRERMVFMEAEIDRLGLVYRGYTRDDERQLLDEAMGAVRGWPIWYCEESHPTSALIRAEVRRAKELHGIETVFVDHLGYVEGRGETERDRITDAVATLKGVAQDEYLPVVATSHVNRAGAGSGDWLKLTDLHGASGIEKDSDQVLLMTPCKEAGERAWAPMTADEVRQAKRSGVFTVAVELPKNRHGGYAMEYMTEDWGQGGRFVPLGERHD